MDSKHLMAGSASLDLRVTSVALMRLVEEVAGGRTLSAVRGYNRTHNRHNR
jgi:hypothetical protein